MKNDLGLKLIAVIDLNKLKTYEAQGIKITREISEIPLAVHKEHRHEKGYFKRTSVQGAGFEPHTSEKDIEYLETSKLVVSHLEELVANNAEYKQLMIAADSKILGHVRGHLTNQLKKILTKEIVKDLAHENLAKVEQVFFS